MLKSLIFILTFGTFSTVINAKQSKLEKKPYSQKESKKCTAKNCPCMKNGKICLCTEENSCGCK